MPDPLPLPHFSHKQFLKADKDPAKAASLVDLVYVRGNEAGITRVKKGSTFEYTYQGGLVRDKQTLARIEKLVIPPAWENVWISPLENGHIQVTGLDARGRKQYRYHTRWNLLRSETKFHRLYEFGNALPKIRAVIEKDINGKDITQSKVMAVIISLMERTYIRVGNNEYEKLNGSYGLTTLKNRHAHINGDNIAFSFRGKKGVHHDITLKNRKLVKAVKECRDIPGKELFQYYDAEGNKKPVDSGMVNHYIKEAADADFSAKDFRTWAGSLQALQAFRVIGCAETDTECKKNIVNVIDAVSKKLGNTRNVCRKYYVHPSLVKLYEEKQLDKYLKELDSTEKAVSTVALTAEEQVLLKILKSS